jgi:hypothetical protein
LNEPAGWQSRLWGLCACAWDGLIGVLMPPAWVG